ncbi:DUF5047 domain-containing protein [Micromonospora echinospora]|uniref:DUF5047 domain-containing protein n=1 Tax=Micromonospora echinospora TaxID=1877 RepID=UPI0037A60EF9
MRQVSARFLRAVRGSHRMVAQARVVAPGATGVNPAGTDIPVLGGDVQMDASAQIRATLSLTTEGRGMWPTSASGLLAPYGNELFVRRGVTFADGSTEWVSLGYYRITTPEQDRAPDGPIDIAGQDRMAGIVEARLTEPRSYEAGATYGQIMSDLVGEVYPWATIEWDDDTDTQAIGRSVIVEDDRHKFLADLVTGVGKVWRWDHRGILTILSLPDPGQPVWDVNHGEGGVLVTLARRLTRVGVYNAVVAAGEAADTSAPVRAVAVDNNPLSPTYWHGPFGKVPRFFSSPLLTSVDQAANAAGSMLSRQLGVPYSADFTAVPNPALEDHDPIRVTYPGRSETHVLDRLTVPLVADAAMSASTREQSTILIEEL